MSRAQEFLDKLVLELRRRRWVIVRPKLVLLDLDSGGVHGVQFDFICPCGRTITESIRDDRINLKGAAPVDLLVRHYLPLVEHELLQHVREEFGRVTQ